MPKYVTPNSLTFSSNAIHCARESGSAMKDGTDEKFFRDAVLDVKSKRLSARGKDRVQGGIRNVVVHGCQCAIRTADRTLGNSPGMMTCIELDVF